MPEGAEVTLLSGTQSADGYLWRNVTYNSQTGWADSEYLVFSPTGTPTPPAAPVSLRQLQSDDISPIAAGRDGDRRHQSFWRRRQAVPAASNFSCNLKSGRLGRHFRLQRLPARQFKEGRKPP